MAPQTTYLVTGANRGKGLGLVSSLLQRPNTVVVSTVRDKSTDTSRLLDLPKANNSSLIILQLNASDPDATVNAIKELTEKHNIHTLDVVIANSGIANYYGLASITPASEPHSHSTIDTVAPLLLFQATLPLLLHSSQPRFVAVSSGVASIGDMASMPMRSTAYGASRAALNDFVGKIHHLNEGSCAFVINPGWVQTQMGGEGAASMGMEQTPVTVGDSAEGISGVVDKARREETSGTFQSFVNR